MEPHYLKLKQRFVGNQRAISGRVNLSTQRYLLPFYYTACSTVRSESENNIAGWALPPSCKACGVAATWLSSIICNCRGVPWRETALLLKEKLQWIEHVLRSDNTIPASGTEFHPWWGCTRKESTRCHFNIQGLCKKVSLLIEDLVGWYSNSNFSRNPILGTTHFFL